MFAPGKKNEEVKEINSSTKVKKKNLAMVLWDYYLQQI